MTNKDWLNFKFVDRINERNRANNFLKQNSETKVLVVTGKKNAGKNFFIDEIIKENSTKTFVVLDFNESGFNTLKQLIDKMQEIKQGTLLHFIQQNYTSVVQMTERSVKSIAEIANVPVVKIISYLLDISVAFLNLNQEQESSVKVLNKYIKEIAKYEDLVIVMKNFSYCDDYSFPIIFQLISSTVDDSQIDAKYLISIDEDDFKANKNNIFSFFSYKIPVLPIQISKFTNPILFYEMLSDIFNFTAEDRNSLTHIFEICNGYPGELKSIISNIYFFADTYNTNITYTDTGKIKWDANAFNEIIVQSSKSNEKDNLKKDPIAKAIFLIVLFLKVDLSYDLLIKITQYICAKIHITFASEADIEKSIQNLLYKLNMLEIDFTENIIITPALNQEKYCYKYSQWAPLFSKYLFEFLLRNRDLLLTTINLDKYYEQLSWHAYKSEYPNWEIYNLKIGKKFYKSNQISLAKNIFLRLQEKWDSFSIEDKYLIAECFYNSGAYDLADNITTNIYYLNCNYQQLILKVKIKNINLKKQAAINLLDSMLLENRFRSKQYEILDFKQRILSNIEQERKNAKKIFDNLLHNYEENKLEDYPDFLISSMEYYRGQIVQEKFNILEEFYRTENNQIMLAELSVNRGFDLFWQGKISEAKDQFKNSMATFERLRIHELSYVLNNYANCLMMEGLFEDAIDELRRGLMFNESPYTEIVLKTHLMICYAIMDNQDYIKIFHELELYIQNNLTLKLDISIYLKVTYALGFVQELCGNDNQPTLFKIQKNYCQKAVALAKAYDPQTLPYIWFKDWDKNVEKDIIKRVDPKYVNFYNFRFEPWLVTITHD